MQGQDDKHSQDGEQRQDGKQGEDDNSQNRNSPLALAALLPKREVWPPAGTPVATLPAR
jgi:hypothetical protein